MKKLLPHICLELALVDLVLAVLDQVNPTMHFLSRNLFKIPLIVFLILVVILALQTILRQRADFVREELKAEEAEPNINKGEAKL